MCYVTTSRKAGPITRRLARSFSVLFGCYYKNRGKMSFNAILDDAASKGMHRVIFVYEYHSNPRAIKAVDVHGDEWDDAGQLRFNCVKVKRVGRNANLGDVFVEGCCANNLVSIFKLRSKNIHISSSSSHPMHRLLKIKLKDKDNEVIALKILT